MNYSCYKFRKFKLNFRNKYNSSNEMVADKTWGFGTNKQYLWESRNDSFGRKIKMAYE